MTIMKKIGNVNITHVVNSVVNSDSTPITTSVKLKKLVYLLIKWGASFVGVLLPVIVSY